MGVDWLNISRRTWTAVRAVVIGSEFGRCHGNLVVPEVHCLASNLRIVFLWKRARELVVGRRDLMTVRLEVTTHC